MHPTFLLIVYQNLWYIKNTQKQRFWKYSRKVCHHGRWVFIPLCLFLIIFAFIFIHLGVRLSTDHGRDLTAISRNILLWYVCCLSFYAKIGNADLLWFLQEWVNRYNLWSPFRIMDWNWCPRKERWQKGVMCVSMWPWNLCHVQERSGVFRGSRSEENSCGIMVRRYLKHLFTCNAFQVYYGSQNIFQID